METKNLIQRINITENGNINVVTPGTSKAKSNYEYFIKDGELYPRKRNSQYKKYPVELAQEVLETLKSVVNTESQFTIRKGFLVSIYPEEGRININENGHVIDRIPIEEAEQKLLQKGIIEYQ